MRESPAERKAGLFAFGFEKLTVNPIPTKTRISKEPEKRTPTSA
jgi:hypothetical protein